MGWDSDSDSGDENNESNASYISVVLLILDTSESMFEVDKNSECQFKKALQCFYEIMDNYLIKGARRGVFPIALGVVSENTEKILISDFKDHLPTTVKKLRELCEKSIEELSDMYKRTDTIELSNVLLLCKSKLNACGPRCVKYIAYITQDSNPVGDNDDARRLCWKQAQSFPDFTINLELLPLSGTFVYEAFFQELVKVSASIFNDEFYPDMITVKDKILSLVRYRGRKLSFFPFPDEQNYFEVIEKRYIKPLKLLNNVKVTKDTHEEIIKITENTFTGTYSVNYSKLFDPIQLTQAERDTLVKDDILCGLTLLGIHKGSIIDVGLHSSDPKFIQSNRNIENCPHFDIFWQYCVDKDSVLICLKKYKNGGPTKLVQLTPKVVNNIRSFLELGIPFFSDMKLQDINAANYKRHYIENPQITEAAENLVNALNFQYNPLRIHDTVKCRKLEYIKSVLMEEKPKEVPDIVDLKVVEADVTEVVEAFKKLTPVTGLKRKAQIKTTSRKK